MPASSTTGRLCVNDPSVASDVDTFLTTVYCLIDDLYRQHTGPVRAHLPGRPGELSDSEVLTLAVLCQWQTSGSERQFLVWATRHWRSYFPRLVSQSAFNRRARQLYGVLAGLSEWIRQAVEPHLGGARVYEVIDGVPVPLMRRCRGRRQRCFGLEADFGHGGSDQELYYGVKVLAAVNGAGFLSGWVIRRPVPRSAGWPKLCLRGANGETRRRRPPTTWRVCSAPAIATVAHASGHVAQCADD